MVRSKQATMQATIEDLFQNQGQLDPPTIEKTLKPLLEEIVLGLENGSLRVAEKINHEWKIHVWLKQAILLYFRFFQSNITPGGFSQFYDKVPMRFTDTKPHHFAELKIRVVPPASVRRGCYLGPNTIVMPSFVNIGAFVDEGTMIDTWATVGSCAQIGKRVHLSGGVGIGGVLEPLQANPTIIEDDCFIGARSEIVEGVVVEQGSVISMGVYLGQSTRIYNRETQEITYGRVPAGSVVVAGNLPSQDGKYSLYCAVIVKQVDEKTRAKVPLNELLRYTQSD